MSITRVALIFGTRPEAIKLAPIYFELKKNSDRFLPIVIATGQHREMLDQALSIFGISSDYDLNIMRQNQDLFDVSVNALAALKPVLNESKPDYILVQGDTTTTFVGALAGFYRKTKIGHVEAGLRTYNKFSPYPEEANRCLTSVLADLHFAPTQQASKNLLEEKVNPNSIFITGNTSIDALLWVISNCSPDFEQYGDKKLMTALQQDFILVTSHRRENFGEPMRESFSAIAEIASTYPNVHIIFPVHKNPNVRNIVWDILGNKENICLCEPLGYIEFAHLLNRCKFILTDSGGIQEEGPSVRKPILVMRDTTERPEGISAGTAKLVGTNKSIIISESDRLLSDPQYYQSMIKDINPYGDGYAAKKIIDILGRH